MYMVEAAAVVGFFGMGEFMDRRRCSVSADWIGKGLAGSVLGVSKNSIQPDSRGPADHCLQADSIHNSSGERYVHSHRIFASDAGARHGRTTTGGTHPPQ